MSQKTSKRKATAKQIKRLYSQLSDKQRRHLIVKLVERTTFPVYVPEVEEPDIDPHADLRPPWREDPMPGLTKLGGVHLEPMDKHYLTEGLYLMGQLIGEGAIRIPTNDQDAYDFDQDLISGAIILSRALFRSRYELMIDGSDDHANDKS